jgi:hypothetical protein
MSLLQNKGIDQASRAFLRANNLVRPLHGLSMSSHGPIPMGIGGPMSVAIGIRATSPEGLWIGTA